MKKFVVQEYDEEPSATTKGREFEIEMDEQQLNIKSTTKQAVSYQFLRELFLPIGYPQSVAPGYLNYQIYDSIQGLCSYLRAVFCSAAVLESLGVGNETATAVGAALTWALKDGAAMLGSLLYSYYMSRYFDSFVKEFRLFADIMNDIGLTIDMMTPWFPNQLLLVSSLSILCKTVCGISAGATKSSITLHFAISGNMADLNAKESTQETLMNIVGMLCGIVAAKQMKSIDGFLNWSLFILLTVIHVWANYQGVRLLRLKTLNRARAERVFAELLEDPTSPIGNLPTPDQVDESLWTSASYIVQSHGLELGVPITTVLPHVPLIDNQVQKYILAQHSTRNGHILVSLLVGCEPIDELRAFLEAKLLLAGHGEDSFRLDMTKIVAELGDSGWDVDRFYLGFGRSRSRIRSKDD